MKEVVLFHGNAEDKQYWIPYSIFSLASALAEGGYEVKMFDENCKKNSEVIWEEITLYLKENCNNILFVGISAFIGKQIQNGMWFAKLVKEFNENIPILWGGWHPSVLPELTIRSEYCDYVLIGQGEESIVNFAKMLNEKLDLSDVRGLVYTDNSDNIIFNEPVISKNRSDLPKFNWNLIHIDDYIFDDPSINSRTVSYISSQGCPLNCGFCSDSVVYKRRWHSLTAEQVVDDLEYLTKNYSINGISFYDSNFFVNHDRTIKMCELLNKKKISLKWVAAGDIVQLLKYSDNDWKLMKESGCSKILMGAESGSNEILKLIGKKFTKDDIIRVALKANEYDISVYFTFITGWPPNPRVEWEETKELIDKMLGLMKSHEYIIHIYAPFLGTPLYKMACDNGYIPPATLEEWADYNYYEITTPWIDTEFLNDVKKYRLRTAMLYKINKART